MIFDSDLESVSRKEWPSNLIPIELEKPEQRCA